MSFTSKFTTDDQLLSNAYMVSSQSKLVHYMITVISIITIITIIISIITITIIIIAVIITIIVMWYHVTV